MQYQQLSSTLSEAEKLNRLQKQAALNISHHFARLGLLTENFSLAVEEYEDTERDYLVSLLYTINENLAVLNFTGAKDLIDALFLNMLDGRAWYDAAINLVHTGMVDCPSILEDMADFEEMLNTLNPPQEPMPDELGDDDDDALTEDERGLLNNVDPDLNDIAGGNLNGKDS